MADRGPDPTFDLRRANAELTAARRASLNIMEDAVLARDALRASEARQAFLLKLSDALRPLGAAGDILPAAARLVGEHLGLAHVLYFDAAGAEYVVTHAWARGGPPAAPGRHPLAAFGAKALADLRAGRPAVSADTRADPDLPAAVKAGYAAAGILAYVFVPLVKGGVLVGGLGVTAARPQGWTADEVTLLAEVADRTWEAVNRATAEAALRASEERFRLLVEGVADHALYAKTPDGRVSSWNAGAERLFGYAAAEVVGESVARFLTPEDRAAGRLERELDAAAAAGRADDEIWMVRKDGSRFWASAVCTAVRDAAGELTGFVKVVRDRTESRAAEEAVRQAEERLRLALAAARMGIWTLDAASGTHTRDANLNRLLGLDPVETSQPFDEFLAHVHPADRDAVDAAFGASLDHGRPLNVEFRVVRPDGTVRWLRDQGDVFHEAGRRQMAGACVDVTERAAAEAAVRASEERLTQIVRSATDYAILTHDDARVVTSWSPGAAATFGYAADEIVGRSSDELFTPEDRVAGTPQHETETARRDGRAADERWHVRKDGSRFYASGVLTPLATGGFVKVARDLTDRKRMEDELTAARDRLEERVAERTAELAAAVDALEAEMNRRRETALRLSTAQEDERKRVSRDLHDTVGQTHAGLAMALKAVADALPPGGEAAKRLVYARKLADDMGRELHAVAVRLRPTALDDLGLEAALRDLVATWARRACMPADVYVGLGGTRPTLEVETALYRVVQEALTNVARHAKATTVSVMVTRTDGAIQTVVEDNGVGFDPTAASTRLGLMGMRERLELLRGELHIESAPDRGTTVIARIPANPES